MTQTANDRYDIGPWWEPIADKAERLNRLTPYRRSQLEAWVDAELETSSTEGRTVTDALLEHRMSLHGMRVALMRGILPYEE